MILIDGPMPKRCAECPCFDDTMYGRCRVKDIWLGANDGAWFTEQRPSWCPLKEVVQCKDCKYAYLTSDGECKYCEMEKDDNGSLVERYCSWDWFCADGAKRTFN